MAEGKDKTSAVAAALFVGYKSHTVKRAIIVWQNNNQQIKFPLLGLKPLHCFLISCFQDSVNLVWSSTMRRKHWLRIECLHTTL